MQVIHKEDVKHTAKRQGSALGIAVVLAALYVIGWQLFGEDLDDTDDAYFGRTYEALTDALD